MGAIGINHVTIHADNVDESANFYKEIFGMSQTQAPNLGNPLVWLQCGETQLHIVERDTKPQQYHHFGITVDNFEEIFEKAKDRELFDDRGDDSVHQQVLYELPDGSVQMYLRDPANNMVEVNWPDVTTLDSIIKEQIVDRSEQFEQSEAQLSAQLLR